MGVGVGVGGSGADVLFTLMVRAVEKITVRPFPPVREEDHYTQPHTVENDLGAIC